MGLRITPSETPDRLPGTVVLTLSGELDLMTAPRVEQAVRAALNATTRQVVIDLAAVTYVDSAGLGVLLRAKRLAAAASVPLWVAGVDGQPRARLIRTALASVLLRD